jgi:chromosome segregation ATPase
MARSGVSYIDVAKTAETIKESGNEPTVDRVRERLGTGSKSTITPLLKQWKAQNLAAMDVSGLPGDLVEVVRSLYKRVEQDAISKIEDVTSSFNEAANTLKQEIDDSQRQNSVIIDQNNELILLNKTATSELKVLHDQATKYQLKQAKTQIEALNDATTIQGLKASLKEVKEDNRAAREHLEHYQARVAEERNVQNQEQQRVTQQLQEQVKQMSTELSELNSRLHNRQQELSHREGEFHVLSLESQELKHELAKKTESLDVLNVKMMTDVGNYEQLSVKLESLQKNYSDVFTDKSSALKDIELLNDRLVYVQSELEAFKHKLSVLDENYKIALQEKAIIEGQYTQLQRSIEQ